MTSLDGLLEERDQLRNRVFHLEGALATMIALCRHKASNSGEEKLVEAAVALLKADE